MILDFLKKYEHAVSLDNKTFDRYFTSGIQRPDFILFRDKIICEVKEFKDVEKKARMAARTNACGFFLVYVRPPSSGTADLRPVSFKEAANRLAQSCRSIANHEMWLASVMLDWTSIEQPQGYMLQSESSMAIVPQRG